MPEFESPSHHRLHHSQDQRLHHSQGNIYAEVEHDYEVDSGFTEESVELTSDRNNRATILRELNQDLRRSKPYLAKRPAYPMYSSDDSELDQGRRQFTNRTSERIVLRPEDSGGTRQERQERGRYDTRREESKRHGANREGHCALHSLYSVARDGL